MKSVKFCIFPIMLALDNKKSNKMKQLCELSGTELIKYVESSSHLLTSLWHVYGLYGVYYYNNRCCA